MQIFVINLDRNPMRWNRMAKLLDGLNFQRIAAVDGKNLQGPEFNRPGRQASPEMLSRYNRACLMSHRTVCEKFLSGPDPYCCVLEDDVLISPEFPEFMNGTNWIPADVDLIKLETTRMKVCLSAKGRRCLNRAVKLLRSTHLGTAAYVVSRRGARKILDLTNAPDRSIDRVMFEDEGLVEFRPYQMVPALCIQFNATGNDLIFSEMESTIQPKPPKPVEPPREPVKFHVLNKIQREIKRPFGQLKGLPAWTMMRIQGTRCVRVPFA
jgi:glycosyl transferase family 25